MFALQPLSLCWPLLRPYRSWLFFSLVMAIPLAALRAGPVPLIKYLVDDLLVKKDANSLWILPAAVIGLYALNLVIRFAHYYAIRIVVVGIGQSLRERVYGHLTRLSVDYFSEQKTGVLMSRVIQDPATVENGISAFNVVVREPITFVALLGYALYTNWHLTVLTFVIAPMLAWVFSWAGKLIKSRIHQVQEKNGEAMATLQETIAGARVVHLFNLHRWMGERFSKDLTEVSRLLLKISKVEELSHPLVELITSFAIAIILYFGGSLVLSGEMTSGDLVAFFAAFGMMINPIRMLTDINNKLHSSAAALDRINEFLSWKPRVTTRASCAGFDGTFSEVRFESVGFAYPDQPDRPVLQNVSFVLPKGKCVALVGASGSGKSSIAQLVARLYDVTSGRILVDGIDLRDIDVDSWRNSMAFVSQDVFLFHDTIHANIALGAIGLETGDVGARDSFSGWGTHHAGINAGPASESEHGGEFGGHIPPLMNGIGTEASGTAEYVHRKNGIGLSDTDRSGGNLITRIREASRRANALDYIERLPNGFNTEIGDRGVKLSGGERQRLSIARAFLRDAPLLVLDEATSNLDNESERKVQASLDELMKNRTTLVIAHRLSTIRNADHVIVLDHGAVVESGTWDELQERRGVLWRLSQ